jgi:hypothetical protein
MNAAAAVITAAKALLSAPPAIAARIAEGDDAALPLDAATGILLRSENVSLQPDLAEASAMAAIDLLVELRQRGPNDQAAAVAMNTLLTAAHSRLLSVPALNIDGARLTADDDFMNFETDKGGEEYLHTCTLRYRVHASIDLLTLELEA